MWKLWIYNSKQKKGKNGKCWVQDESFVRFIKNLSLNQSMEKIGSQIGAARAFLFPLNWSLKST